MESQSKSSAKCGDFGPKSSWIFSFLSLLLIVALFIRMETISNKTEMNEMRISKVESNMKIMAFQTNDDDEEMESFQDSRKKMASAKVRRSLIPASNSSLSIDDVRREINKHIKQLKPKSLCSPSEKVCVQGPPGKKGSRGSRGRRGATGDKGKKGTQGIMGPPGRHGKQGIMGDPGIKGEKGEEGAAGPRGMTGLKGDPGESISIPEVMVSPDTKTVSENQTATFYCSASGNPQPTVTWTKVKGSLARSHINQRGRLGITHSTFNDSGDYKCTAVNILGRDEKIAKLIVEVGPRLTTAPDRFLVINEQAVASLTCKAFSYPPSVVTWTRALAALPKGRSSVSNGVLTIQDFSTADTGTYVCTARNKLGSVTALTTLSIQRKPRVNCNCWRSRSRIPYQGGGWGYSNDPSGSGNVDAIDFQTDGDVILQGYRLWGVYGGSTSYRVTIRLYRADTLIAERTGSYATSSSIKTFEVLFSQGISIRGGVTYTATARIVTSEYSFYLHDGMSSTSCSGVTVTFKSSSKSSNGSNSSRGQIPALIFRSLQC